MVKRIAQDIILIKCKLGLRNKVFLITCLLLHYALKIMIMNRRTAISLSLLGLAGATTYLRAASSNSDNHSTGQKTSPAREKRPMTTDFELEAHPEKIENLSLNEEQWRQRLTPDAFYVLRQEGTERPFTSPLNDEKRVGEFVCAGCGLALFTSAQKYDSGTGWPSFSDALEGRIETKTDYKLLMPRTEYHCARCGGHQGHVFKDGPQPTGLRYCNNGVALRFIPA